MNQNKCFILAVLSLLAIFLLPGCSPDGFATPTPSEPWLTVTEIQQDYPAHADELVHMRGYGVTMMTAPLCPGYTGMDTRMVFIDEEEHSIVAVLPGDMWDAVRGDELREFQGYVRVFNGDIGCPGDVHTEAFPYFEVVMVE